MMTRIFRILAACLALSLVVIDDDGDKEPSKKPDKPSPQPQPDEPVSPDALTCNINCYTCHTWGCTGNPICSRMCILCCS